MVARLKASRQNSQTHRWEARDCTRWESRPATWHDNEQREAITATLKTRDRAWTEFPRRVWELDGVAKNGHECRRKTICVACECKEKLCLRSSRSGPGLEFASFYVEYRNYARAIATDYEKRPDVLDELVAHCFTEAWASWLSFKGESSRKTWFHSLVKKQCAQHVEKETKVKILLVGNDSMLDWLNSEDDGRKKPVSDDETSYTFDYLELSAKDSLDFDKTNERQDHEPIAEQETELDDSSDIVTSHDWSWKPTKEVQAELDRVDRKYGKLPKPKQWELRVVVPQTLVPFGCFSREYATPRIGLRHWIAAACSKRQAVIPRMDTEQRRAWVISRYGKRAPTAQELIIWPVLAFDGCDPYDLLSAEQSAEQHAADHPEKYRLARSEARLDAIAAEALFREESELSIGARF